MSEFSDSVHFYNIPEPELRTQLIHLKVKAFILNMEGNPISVLINWEDKAKCYHIANVLDFSFGEDHGVTCKFYTDGKLVARANRDWGEDFDYEEPAGSPNAAGLSENFAQTISELNYTTYEKALSIIKLFETTDTDDFSNREKFVSGIANLLNLQHYQWLSCEDMEYNPESLLDINKQGEVDF